MSGSSKETPRIPKAHRSSGSIHSSDRNHTPRGICPQCGQSIAYVPGDIEKGMTIRTGILIDEVMVVGFVHKACSDPYHHDLQIRVALIVAKRGSEATADTTADTTTDIGETTVSKENE